MENSKRPTQKSRTRFLLPLTILAASTTTFTPAIAQQTTMTAPEANISAYTPVDLDKCHFITQAELGLPELTEEEEGIGTASWLCIGYNHSIVYVAEGDLRMFVSYGPDAVREKASFQTLPQFNYIGDQIEWRLHTDQTATASQPSHIPFATIVSWVTESGEMAEIKGEILVVTKLEPGNTCHIAYIDVNMPVLANQQYDPHQIARDFADSQAADFNCETDEPFLIPS